MELETVENATENDFVKRIYPKREPVILRGLDIGDCSKKWTVDYLARNGGHQDTKIHVTSGCQMDFRTIEKRTMPFDEFVYKAAEENQKEKYYLRPLVDNSSTDVVDITVQYPGLSSDVTIPQCFSPEKFFSSVFRIASKGVQLWTHYDVMDNILIQIVGRKKVVIFHPQDVNNLYMIGTKSEVFDVDSPDLDKYPKFAQARPYIGYLEPGDVLFIPALWFHNMTYEDFGVAVNVFWHHLRSDMYDKSDPYANLDPLPAQRANQLVDGALGALAELPAEYQDFYARRLYDKIRSKAYM